MSLTDSGDNSYEKQASKSQWAVQAKVALAAAKGDKTTAEFIQAVPGASCTPPHCLDNGEGYRQNCRRSVLSAFCSLLTIN